ncbi:uncharacterized protein LOC113387989 [Ctenocephalides felis]|uniref:uncharacterized protein LOC113387989 n=1 Tax=Ctenocephalides felis TaxID=7515 RepID=UPI000E6E4855|nr:uncharacterized protein LOC113387989 [Ctenocephalides felis]
MEVFIEIYRNEPCLWQVKSAAYHDKNFKNSAYDKLVEQYKYIEPSANRNLIVKKINSLHTNYKKENKKIDESKRSGAGTSEVYEPKLWYFKHLTFLDDDHSVPRAHDSNISGINFDQEIESDCFIDDGDEELSVRASSIPSCSSEPSGSSRPPKRKRRSTTEDLQNEVLMSINKRLNNPTEDYEAYGKYIAATLRRMPKTQTPMLKNIIDQAIFKAEMGELNRGVV